MAVGVCHDGCSGWGVDGVEVCAEIVCSLHIPCKIPCLCIYQKLTFLHDVFSFQVLFRQVFHVRRFKTECVGLDQTISMYIQYVPDHPILAICYVLA